MAMSRRDFVRLAAGASAAPAFVRRASAQAYPARTVQMLVPYAPGGGTDLAARLIGQWLSERLGQQFIVINRPGAGSNVGTEAVVRARPDGYTLLVFDPSAAINATLYDRLDFVFLRDIAPVALLVRTPLIMVVNPAVPATTVPAFVAYAKANPGKINMGSGGIGTTPHVSGELFNMMAGVKLVHVPYRGSGPARTDLIAGQVQVMFDAIAQALEYVKGGQLRALAVCTPTRAEVLPDVPAIAEFVPGYASDTWYGVGAPKGTAPEIIETLNREINAGLADPRIKARLAELGGTVVTGSPAEFGKLLADETEKWGKVVKFSGVKAD
ncbi:MAG TPA: tripartite tricarboxylate transporter substrate binding protein [Xanthobacteraceae bacterium]|nr:tripartite tricarboxylate transporter substrate binding protein [Xanthobacteraceae bacterium]